MTSGVYPRTPGTSTGNGGKRRNALAPALSPTEVADIREMRAHGVPYKLIARKYPLNRCTLSRAANGRDTYA